MRIKVKTSQGGGMFGGGPSSEVVIEGSEADAAQGTISAMMLLAQNGIGEYPGDDEETDDDSPEEGYTESDDVPAAAWGDSDRSDPTQRPSDPGDVVRLVWPGGESRLFIDNGTCWVSPAVVGLFDEPMTIEYSNSEVRVQYIASQPPRGESAPEEA
ncbi:hypothetical protein SEA_PULCHRA_64 [Microbacterium phage Pulchra]|uniref:Uncharacterized protein n=1 Tax=Microbacterium phage Pulchra TaxID=2816469 RepID=A0A8A5LL73_9CAUD|nr:hypothetical protein SEA_PULCHRA_64 [Microbacterium phage Pulchra]